MENFAKTIGEFIIKLVVVGLFAFLLAFPTMWLWNWLMPSLFNLRIIGFWEALVINIFFIIIS